MRRLLVGLLALMSVGPVWAVTPVDPTAPTAVSINPAPSALRYPCLNGSPGVCNTSAEVIAALASAQCGDWILLNHSNTFAPATNYALPILSGSCVGIGTGAMAIFGSSGARAVAGSAGASATTAGGGDNFLVITTDRHSSLPALGTRINTSDQVNMPSIIVPNNTLGGVFIGQPGTHHIRIQGLNMTVPTAAGGTCSTASVCGFIQLISTTGSDNHHLLFDHNFMTGDATNGSYEGLQIDGAHIAVRDNRITNIWDPVHGHESHALLMRGAGPYDADNNELCSASIGAFVGDSAPTYWTGGSVGAGSPIMPSDGTVRRNYDHKKCVPSTPRILSKNLFEIKQGNRWLIDSNVFDTSYWGNQNICIQLVSMRGTQSSANDIDFTNNWVKNCPVGLGVTFRPTEQITITGMAGDGTTNCSGGPCVKVTLAGPCDCSTGDIVNITGTLNTTEANGTWVPITRIDSTHITIPVAFSHAYGSPGGNICTNAVANDSPCAQFYFHGTPAQRIRIKNNLFSNIANAVEVNGAGSPSTIQVNAVPNLTSILTGGTDGSTSTTGDWQPNDLNISHNTVVTDTGVTSTVLQFFKIIGDATTTNVWQGDRWAIRDNVIRVSDSTGYTSVLYDIGLLGGTTALNKISNPATRDFSHNIGFLSTAGGEAASFTGSDTWILDTSSDCTAVLFVACGTNTIAAAALQAGSVGHATASDGTDVGIDATALAAAVSGVTP